MISWAENYALDVDGFVTALAFHLDDWGRCTKSVRKLTCKSMSDAHKGARRDPMGDEAAKAGRARSHILLARLPF